MEESVVRGKIAATTYGQLTRSANQRLFKLRDKIPARYEEVSGADLMSRVMQTPSQAGFDIREDVGASISQDAKAPAAA